MQQAAGLLPLYHFLMHFFTIYVSYSIMLLTQLCFLLTHAFVRSIMISLLLATNFVIASGSSGACCSRARS